MIAKKFRPSIAELGPLIEEVLKEGKEIKITVTGNSMYPLFRHRTDCVVIEGSSDFKKYDVVLYKRKSGQYVFHRILKIDGDNFTIAGDNEVTKEYPVKREACFAKLKRFERFGRQYSVNALWYRMYSRLWLLIFPFRHKLVAFIKMLARLKRRIRLIHH